MKTIKMKSKINLIFISLFSMFFLSSCSLIEYLWWMMCTLAPDSDHCYQFIAVQSSSPEACENIKWTSFKDIWSNPPKDKCYMQIAQNTWDESICDNVKWWPMSYTKDECKWKARTTFVFNLDEKIKNLDEKIKYSVWFTETEKLLKEKEKLEKQLRETFNKLPDEQKSQYYTKKKDEILDWITDEDLKQQIAHNYNRFRLQYKDDILTQLEWLKKITQTEKIAKELDENANMLVDTVKNVLVWMVNDKLDETKWAILDEAKEKLLEEAYKRSWTNMKLALSKLESLKESYDKWSEYYNSVNEKYEKLKAAYDKMKDIQDKISKIEKLWKEWKLDSWKVEVLKWSLLLWEWLEYATSYVPVFWSTISTVTKETFWVVNKFATNRAIRTTAIDKCIDDPLNCNTDDISWY